MFIFVLLWEEFQICKSWRLWWMLENFYGKTFDRPWPLFGESLIYNCKFPESIKVSLWEFILFSFSLAALKIITWNRINFANQSQSMHYREQGLSEIGKQKWQIIIYSIVRLCKNNCILQTLSLIQIVWVWFCMDLLYITYFERPV